MSGVGHHPVRSGSPMCHCIACHDAFVPSGRCMLAVGFNPRTRANRTYPSRSDRLSGEIDRPQLKRSLRDASFTHARFRGLKPTANIHRPDGTKPMLSAEREIPACSPRSVPGVLHLRRERLAYPLRSPAPLPRVPLRHTALRPRFSTFHLASLMTSPKPCHKSAKSATP